MKPKVMLGIPTMGSIHTHLVLLILNLMAKASTEGKYGLTIYTTVAVQPVDNARNEIVRTFLEGDSTHLLFIDSDTVPPPDVIDKLLAMNVPIATGITPIVDYNEQTKEFYRKWNVVDMDDKHVEPNTGIVQARGAGSSCILIRRDVFERLEFPWYRFLYQDKYVISEDIHFTAKANGAGFKTYADTSIICQHAKTTMW